MLGLETIERNKMNLKLNEFLSSSYPNILDYKLSVLPFQRLFVSIMPCSLDGPSEFFCGKWLPWVRYIKWFYWYWNQNDFSF